MWADPPRYGMVRLMIASYSITSSAAASSLSGISKPSAFAVQRGIAGYRISNGQVRGHSDVCTTCHLTPLSFFDEWRQHGSLKPIA